MAISVAHFSPTGSVRKIALLTAERFGGEISEYDLTAREAKDMAFGIDDIVVVAVPVFGGRIPRPGTLPIKRMSGGGAKAVALAVYGNRHYDDALLELCDILTEQGFDVVAAGAVVAQHTISPVAGTGRPDAEDIADIGAFAGRVKEKIASGAQSGALTLPGNRPYHEPGSAKRPIEVSDNCVGCGLCAERCPVAAIPEDNTKETDLDKCFSCMRCIHNCPTGARALPAQMLEKISEYLGQFTQRRANEWYL